MKLKTFSHIVITGASSGIGEALARDYAGPGVALGLTGRHTVRLKSVADACRAVGAVVVADTIDVTERAAMEEWLTCFDDQYPVDLLIANAGVSIDQDRRGLEPFEDARKTMAVNFDGVLNTIEPLASRMISRRAGQIGLVSSQAAFFGRPSAAAYNASKAALRVWGESIRFAMATSGVGVSVICPGFVISRMSAQTTQAKPFLVSASEASRRIRTGLALDQPRIAFPLGITFAVWFTVLLPARWAARLQGA